ncbi:MAG: DUF1893 domain-containing protein [Erysipelotrichaceae bacterium]|nr:DUF1893 domain-containing protein [Erysipelotrichaceae bacterium]
MRKIDLQIAKKNLLNHTICLCKDNTCLFSDKKGISPMMDFINDNIDLNGYSVADLIVGKAVAFLFVKCNIKNVYAKVLSKSGKEILDKYHIYYEYETITEKIINREGNDICPMEKVVLNIDDAEIAYIKLKEKLDNMRNF